MPAVVSTLTGFSYEVQCSMHQCRVFGRVTELGADRGKCQDSRSDSCASWWYVEIHYREFQKPGDEHGTDHPRPAG